MSPRDVTDYLRELCQRIDEGRPLGPFLAKAALPVALPAALAIGVTSATAFGQDADVADAAGDGAAATGETLCADDEDNDGDGFTDCDDADCVDLEECLSIAVPEYGAMGCSIGSVGGRREVVHNGIVRWIFPFMASSR